MKRQSFYGLDLELLEKLNLQNMVTEEKPDHMKLKLDQIKSTTKQDNNENKDYETLRRENQLDSKAANRLRSTCNYFTNEYYKDAQEDEAWLIESLWICPCLYT